LKENDRLVRSAILSTTSSTLGFLEVITGGYCVIDVRSPKEYAEGSLPGAVNIPIFDNEERALVGTIYRQGGRDVAVDTGFELVEERLSKLLLDFAPYRQRKIALFCARGGMRSRSVVNLLSQNGFSAWQLEGGYKQYRQHLLDMLARFCPSCIVLHGLTGTGKTRILQQLDHAIDLEDLAQHQSSLFGGMNREPRSQRWFDAYLHQVICQLGPEPYFVEGESRQMGNIYLPSGLASAMKSGRLVLITASMETRVARILEDYPVDDDQTVAEVERILKSLKRKLGGAITETLCSLLHQGRLAELVETLLTEYYDKRYQNNLLQYSYQFSLSSEDIPRAAAELVAYRESLPLPEVTAHSGPNL
jgi:tRNA 2-selenouridine synthase